VGEICDKVLAFPGLMTTYVELLQKKSCSSKSF